MKKLASIIEKKLEKTGNKVINKSGTDTDKPFVGIPNTPKK